MSDLIVRDESLSELGRSLGGSADSIQRILDSLTQQVSVLRSHWTGEASMAFDRAEASWCASMYEIRGILKAASELSVAAEGMYRTADDTVGNLWSL